MVKLINVYTTFAFQQIQINQLPIVFENGKLHTINFSKNYYLYKTNSNSNAANEECYNLQLNKKISKKIDRSKKDSLEDGTNYEYLNFKQLVQKINKKHLKSFFTLL